MDKFRTWHSICCWRPSYLFGMKSCWLPNVWGMNWNRLMFFSIHVAQLFIATNPCRPHQVWFPHKLCVIDPVSSEHGKLGDLLESDDRKTFNFFQPIFLIMFSTQWSDMTHDQNPHRDKQVKCSKFNHWFRFNQLLWVEGHVHPWLFVESLARKWAIQDQVSLIELLQISCLVSDVWPRLETH